MPAEDDAIVRAHRTFGMKLHPEWRRELASLVIEHIQAVVGRLSAGWATGRLPKTKALRRAILDGLDGSLAAVGLVATDVEIERLEAVA